MIIPHGRRPFLFCVGVLVAFLALYGCSQPQQPENCVYFWRTALTLSSSQREFLSKYNISTLYLHLFDVVNDPSRGLRPEATLRFVDSIPADIRVVPVVFIAHDALPDSTNLPLLAQRLVSRAERMLSLNGYPLPDELQIDFDWAQSSQERYFRLLKEAARLLHARGAKLSVTIRLHQLALPSPPADAGVLMLYNTGNYADPAVQNSILSTQVVKSYAPNLRRYTLPLATALPLYSWDLVFSGSEFQCIARGLNLSDSSAFRPLGGGRFRVMTYQAIPMGARLYPGDIIRHEEVSAPLLDSVASIVRMAKPDAMRRVILYHLDNNCINRYDSNLFHNILNPPLRAPGLELH